LLDKEFNLKIADFGFVAPANGRDGSGKLKTKLGTIMYRAPEIWTEESYNGEKVDIFSSGVILFMLMT
jgi:serine/threonine protein kinase